MPWKMEEDGKFAVCDKGNPVWVDSTGKESSVDYQAMGGALQKASKEAADRKAELRSLADKYGRFADIQDIDAWWEETAKAREMAANAPDAAKAVEEQVQARVKAATEPVNAKMAALNALLAAKDKDLSAVMGQLEAETIKHHFLESPFVRDKMSSPTLAYKLFAGQFKLQEGKLVGFDESGGIIYGDDGAVAPFDMAVAKLAEANPDKGLLFKGSDKAGSGANPGGGNMGYGSPRSLAECKTHAQQVAYLKSKTGAA